jgi:hypothetical protein
VLFVGIIFCHICNNLEMKKKVVANKDILINLRMKY